MVEVVITRIKRGREECVQFIIIFSLIIAYIVVVVVLV